jgi:D-psicose/D-tagatose/L-ribulose 3-epimerase
MKIGVNTWVWTSPFSTKDFALIPKVKEMGFDVLEVALDDASIIDAKLLRKMTEDNGLSVTVCGAFGPTRDVSNEDPAIRKIGVDYILESIRFTENGGRQSLLRTGLFRGRQDPYDSRRAEEAGMGVVRREPA